MAATAPDYHFITAAEPGGKKNRVAYSDTTTSSSSSTAAVAAGGKEEKKPTIICLPGLGDTKEEYRYLAPLLSKQGGLRVVCMDLRGLGDSDTGFASHTPDDTGRDILTLIDHLKLESVLLVGCSLTAASVMWAAAELLSSSSPSSVAVVGVVVLGPFVRDTMPWGVASLLSAFLVPGIGPGFWTSYMRTLFKKQPPADLDEYLSSLKKHLATPGRIRAVRHQIYASKWACERRLPEVKSKGVLVLVAMGTMDPDFPQPETEAKMVADRTGGRYVMVEGVGHYPHVEAPAEVAAHILQFLGHK